MSQERSEDGLIDYAQHLIRIEKLMRTCHELCLKQNYVDAFNEAMHIAAEAKLLATTLKDMRVQQVAREEKINGRV